MLTIFMEDSDTTWYWNVGQILPVQPDCIHSIREIRADGQALALIYEKCRSIPTAPRSQMNVTWYGDHARFICGVLLESSPF